MPQAFLPKPEAAEDSRRRRVDSIDRWRACCSARLIWLARSFCAWMFWLDIVPSNWVLMPDCSDRFWRICWETSVLAESCERSPLFLRASSSSIRDAAVASWASCDVVLVETESWISSRWTCSASSRLMLKLSLSLFSSCRPSSFPLVSLPSMASLTMFQSGVLTSRILSLVFSIPSRKSRTH